MESTEESAIEEAPETGDAAPLFAHPNWLFILVLTLGLLFDFLFWGHPVGVSFAIFTIVVMAGGTAFLMSEGYRPSRACAVALDPLRLFQPCILPSP